MAATLVAIFIIGYLLITLEHPLKLDKTVPALIMAAVMWGLLAVGFHNGWLSIIDEHQHAHSLLLTGSEAEDAFKNALLHHLAKISEILIFLIGAMTIVELIDLHKGFAVIRSYVNTKSRTKLLWIIGFIAFWLSAVIDNLTATIVLVSLLRNLISDDDRRMWYVGMVVIAANAGGAWSPMGDVTTTMLWIADKVTAIGLVSYLVVPSLVCFLIPFGIASVFLRPFRGFKEFRTNEDMVSLQVLSSGKILYLGLGAIVFVPVFKTITDLPPYIGMLLGLGVVWMVSEYVKPEHNMNKANRKLYSAKRALHKIEMSSVLFFLGILLAVAALETTAYAVVNGEKVGTLRYVAEVLLQTIPNKELTIIFLGACSAIVDNVPLVASAIGMFSEPIDDSLWHLLAYCAGTGGSMLIIGSASGVAAMGMENIGFGWYLKNIAWLAAIGFVAGAAVFVVLRPFVG
ncbi:MAG: sodium:proton antiporter NhaD [Pyrinomonadaceae bacterium]|nr:sodium:proton antiporter NhaD [Pyrinomonadaceae bacterium]